MSKWKVMLIPADQDKATEVLEIDDDTFSGDLERLIFEHTDHAVVGMSNFLDHCATMAFDDMGLYSQPNNWNVRAMALWARLAGRSIKDFVQPLVGNYVVMGHEEHTGEYADLPQEVINMMDQINTEGIAV